MFDSCKNSKAQGNIGLGAAISYGCLMGYCVSVPLNDSQGYDLVFEIDGQLKKIQVKTSMYCVPSGSWQIELRQTGGNQSFHTAKPFDKESVDYIFILVENGDKYMIPTANLENKTKITVGNKYAEYKIRG